MDLLYFDFDHGIERLLFVQIDKASRTVHFRFEKAPDLTHDDDAERLPVTTISGSTHCPDDEQFFGFCRALATAMRETAFSLQDPGKRPFAAMPHDALVLDGIGIGVPPSELACHIPKEIACELVPASIPEHFRVLIGHEPSNGR